MGPTLIAYGRPDQQAEFLPRSSSGETTWCIGMSEPDAGSDLAALRTTRRPRRRRVGDQRAEDLDELRRRGRLLLPDLPHVARRGRRTPGISEIIVPMDTPGIEVRPITDMTTNRHFCEVFFTDVRVPAANLVGVEGAAFKQTMRQLEHERGGIDRLVSNRALYRRPLERGRHVRPPRAPGDRRARDRLPDRADPGRPRGAEAGAGRVLGGDQVLLHRARAAGRRVRRPRARRRGDAVGTTTRGLAYAPGYTIMGGTSNVMRNILGERVLGLPR